MNAAWQPTVPRAREPMPFEPILVTARAAPRATPAAMAFDVPDFDAPPPPPGPDPAPAAQAAAAAALEAQLAAAREAGFAEGEATARVIAADSLAAREAAALERIAAALEAARAGIGEAAGEAAETLARLLLAALDAALPDAAARLAPEAALRLAVALRPLLEDGVAVTLRVPPGCAEAVTRLGEPTVVVVEDAALLPGDARAAWRGGGAAGSLMARRQAIAALLETFDLQER